jgi:xylose isomerase
MKTYFEATPKIAYAGPGSENPLAFKWYNKDQVVLGKSMAEHLRFAVCYWHSFCWNGFDPFGYDGTFERPWQKIANPMDAASAKADAAFEFFQKLGAPFYCFHDRDVAPEGATPRESVNNLHAMVDVWRQNKG